MWESIRPSMSFELNARETRSIKPLRIVREGEGGGSSPNLLFWRLGGEGGAPLVAGVEYVRQPRDDA